MPSRPGVLLFGSRVSWAGRPPPVDLAPIEGGGCAVHVGPAVVFDLGTNATCSATLSLPIPLQVAPVGGTLATQCVVMDAAASPLGLVMPNGLAAELRWVTTDVGAGTGWRTERSRE